MNEEKNINGNEVIDASKTEKKKMSKKKKIVIFSIIGTLLVAGGIVLAIALLNRNNDDDYDNLYDDIDIKSVSEKEYQEWVNVIGEKAKQVVLDYYDANGKYPDSDFIENKINDKNTKCYVFNIYNDELKFDHCEFEGYYTNYDVQFLYKFEEIINKNNSSIHDKSNDISSSDDTPDSNDEANAIAGNNPYGILNDNYVVIEENKVVVYDNKGNRKYQSKEFKDVSLVYSDLADYSYFYDNSVVVLDGNELQFFNVLTKKFTSITTVKPSTKEINAYDGQGIIKDSEYSAIIINVFDSSLSLNDYTNRDLDLLHIDKRDLQENIDSAKFFYTYELYHDYKPGQSVPSYKNVCYGNELYKCYFD